MDLTSTEQTGPPEELSTPLQALWWAKKGSFLVGAEWHKAHELCQDETDDLNVVHGFLHWIEGDISNSDYWYSRAREKRQGSDFEQEWERLVTKFEGAGE